MQLKDQKSNYLKRENLKSQGNLRYAHLKKTENLKALNSQTTRTKIF